MKKISQPIVDQSVIVVEPEPEVPNISRMHESFERPDKLLGTTYKIKQPTSEHANYITINDMVMNEGTAFEKRIPFEIFINSKNNEHFQWVTALTRLMSAVFRKGGDVTFLIEELKSVFEPNGGYLGPGGKYRASDVAEIGYVIERHMESIGLLEPEKIPENVKFYLTEKKEEYLTNTDDRIDSTGYPSSAQICKVCSTKAVINTNGCMTCLACADSKCG